MSSAASPTLGERLLPVAAIASALVLGISEFMTAFDVNAAGGDTVQVLKAGDRHWYAMLVLALFAIALIVAHIRTGAQPPIVAAAGLGLLAVLLFLIIDLPKVNDVGDLSEPTAGLITAKAEPQAGFWLELVGALGLALSAGVMATLGRDQESAKRESQTDDRAASRLSD